MNELLVFVFKKEENTIKIQLKIISECFLCLWHGSSSLTHGKSHYSTLHSSLSWVEGIDHPCLTEDTQWLQWYTDSDYPFGNFKLFLHTVYSLDNIINYKRMS